MKRAGLGVPLLILVALAVFWPGDSRAIPAFSRKYGFECTMCHSAFPRLNDFGVRYRENGYRIPGGESREKTVLQGPVPVALRTSAGYTSDRFSDETSPDVNQFQLEGLDLLAGGLMGRAIGFFVVYTPRIESSRGVAGQEGTLESAAVVFPDLGTSWLNLRAGRFEPEYVASSVKRRLSISPYEIYDFTFARGIPLSDTQSGLEVFGHGWKGLRYAAGLLEGADSNASDDGPADAYARVAMVFGAGEGQTAGQRVGLIGYRGKARFADELLEVTHRASFTRYGLDASLNFGQLNVALQYLRAQDDEGFWPGATSDPSYWGGFAELLYQPWSRLVAFARYDRVNAPSVSEIDSLTRYTIGARYYLENQISLHAEYSRRRAELRAAGIEAETENFFTARLDFAF